MKTNPPQRVWSGVLAFLFGLGLTFTQAGTYHFESIPEKDGNDYIIIDIGETIYFSADPQPTNGTVDSTEWTFENGSPATSTDKALFVSYDNAQPGVENKVTCQITRTGDDPRYDVCVNPAANVAKVAVPKVEILPGSTTLNLLSAYDLKSKISSFIPSSSVTDYKFEIKRTSDGSWAELQDGTSDSYSKNAKVAGKFSVKLTATINNFTYVSEEKPVEVQFPGYSDIISDSAVSAKMSAAWQSTLAATTPTSRREEGFWIKLNTASGNYEFTPTDYENPPAGNAQRATITLSPKPADSQTKPSPETDCTYTVADFHTHPPTYYISFASRRTGPSEADVSSNNSSNVVGIVYDYLASSAPAKYPINSPAGTYHSGPNRRSTP